MRVCVFSDYRYDWMHRTGVNISHYALENKCNLNLFVGRVVFEEQPEGLSFNPFVMLNDGNNGKVHVAFSHIPSIFGGTGYNMRESRFFHSVEINGVAFIQFTIEVKTTLTVFNPDFDDNKLYEFFDELMAVEIECKLEELYSRKQKPWIVLYLTHPSLFNEKLGTIFYLSTYPRLFAVLEKYKVDLILVCEANELKATFRQIYQSPSGNGMLTQKMPNYLQTTLVECTSEHESPSKNCNYAVLEINNKKLRYSKKNLLGKVLYQGSIEKSTHAKSDVPIKSHLSVAGQQLMHSDYSHPPPIPAWAVVVLIGGPRPIQIQ
ncbi:hypothetical protein Ddc_03759 [Ditylenchus destructor]|nr:hypothetical protein Ddc_03759 [Ditylenchus destructor]